MSWRGRLSANMQELRIYYCDKSSSSAGVRYMEIIEWGYSLSLQLFCRSFLNKNYDQLTRLNPLLPFQVRYGEGAQAAAYVRYGNI